MQRVINKAIDKTQEFFTNELHIPANLRELGIGEENLEIMAKKAVRGATLKGFVELSAEDVEKIYRMAL